MNDDFDSGRPSPREVEQNLSDLRERTKAAFPNFISERPADPDRPDIQSTHPDPDNFMVIEDVDGQEYVRSYFDYQLGNINKEEKIMFSNTATVIIDKQFETMTLSKFGRRKDEGSVDEQNDESEILNIAQTKDGKEVTYSISNPKGDNDDKGNNIKPRNPTSFSFNYSPHGYIKSFKPETSETGVLIFYDRDHNTISSQIEEQHLRKAIGGDVTLEFGDTTIDVHFSLTDGGIYTATIKGPNGDPLFKATFPDRIDPEEIAADLDFDQLVAHPDQPANGIVNANGENRRSWGDIEWRRASFPNLTGIHITPLDI